jgi:hypothetical protein
MNISSLNASVATNSTRVISSTSAQSSVASTATTSDTSSTKVSLSKPAELLQKLTDLQKSDPAKFKETVTQIADKFKQLADSSDGPESEALSKLSTAFSKAAETGDLSALKQGGGHRPPPPSGDESQGTQSTSANGNSARAANAYRRNGPPPPPPKALEDAFSSALSIVSSATSSDSDADGSSTSTSSTVASA